MSVSQRLFDWTPSNQELANVRWIDEPKWALRAVPAGGIPGMNKREVREDGRNTAGIGEPLIQWEFSNATLRSWTWLLATLLRQVELAINATKDAREQKLTSDEVDGLNDTNIWCYCLYAYVHWREDIVKTLLTKTSLARAFGLSAVPNVAGTQI